MYTHPSASSGVKSCYVVPNQFMNLFLLLFMDTSEYFEEPHLEGSIAIAVMDIDGIQGRSWNH